MKCAVICDTHFGVRNDSQVFAGHIKRFYDDVFFPYLDKHSIKTILHLGDLVDRRKSINFVTLKLLNESFIEKCRDRDITIHIAIGNHDCYYRNKNDVNAVNGLYDLMSYENLHIYDNGPVPLTLGSARVLMVPWISNDNYELTMERLKNTKANVVMGHFEIKGFEMMRGVVSEHGLPQSTFSKFDSVYSGHFHHPSAKGNIEYLGAPYEMNWSDYDGRRGFHVFNTDNLDMEFVPNPNQIYHMIEYDDSEITIEDLNDMDITQFKDKYVKVVMKNKTNPAMFDLFLDRMNEADAADVKVVEDVNASDIFSEDELVDEAEDTVTILHKYVDKVQVAETVDKAVLKEFIAELYTEALNV